MKPRNPAIAAALEAIANGAQEVRVPAGWDRTKFTQSLRHALRKTTGKCYRLVNAQTDTPSILIMEGVREMPFTDSSRIKRGADKARMEAGG
jgi:hypothetical protein